MLLPYVTRNEMPYESKKGIRYNPNHYQMPCGGLRHAFSVDTSQAGGEELRASWLDVRWSWEFSMRFLVRLFLKFGCFLTTRPMRRDSSSHASKDYEIILNTVPSGLFGVQKICVQATTQSLVEKYICRVRSNE